MRVALALPLVLVFGCTTQRADPAEPLASHESAEVAAPVEAPPASEPDEPVDETAEVDANPMPLERRGRIFKVEDLGGATVVTVAAGTADGIDKTWHACVVESASGIRCLADGELVLIRIDKQTLMAKSKLTTAQIRANPTVQLKTP